MECVKGNSKGKRLKVEEMQTERNGGAWSKTCSKLIISLGEVVCSD